MLLTDSQAHIHIGSVLLECFCAISSGYFLDPEPGIISLTSFLCSYIYLMFKRCTCPLILVAKTVLRTRMEYFEVPNSFSTLKLCFRVFLHLPVSSPLLIFLSIFLFHVLSLYYGSSHLSFLLRYRDKNSGKGISLKGKQIFKQALHCEK